MVRLTFVRVAALVTALAVPVTPVLAAPAAPAAEPADTDARARELYENGAALYREGRYEAAVVAWEQALKLSGRHTLLLNIAGAWERLGRLDEAIDALNRYRVYAKADERETLAKRVAALEERRDAERAAAAEPPEPSPPPPSPAAPPPTSAPTTAAPTAPTPLPSPVRRRRTAGYVLIGTGSALAAGFGAIAGVTYAQSRTFLDTGDREAWEALRPLNNASVAAGATGGALLLTGIILAAVPEKPGAAASWRPSVGVGPTEITLRWRWP
jgi:tetratricopeptide (TPR) repeat protein